MEGSISADELALWPHAADLAWAHNFQTKFLGAEPRYCARRDQRRDTRGRPRARSRARIRLARRAPLSESETRATPPFSCPNHRGSPHGAFRGKSPHEYAVARARSPRPEFSENLRI